MNIEIENNDAQSAQDMPANKDLSNKVEKRVSDLLKKNIFPHDETELHCDASPVASGSHSSKDRYIFLIVDAFIKFVKLYATKSTGVSQR